MHIRHRLLVHHHRVVSPSPPSQILLPRRHNPRPEDRTAHLHIDLVERVHDRLDPVLVDLREELLDRLLGLRRCWVRSDGRARARGRRGCGLRGRVEEEEFDICVGM